MVCFEAQRQAWSTLHLCIYVEKDSYVCLEINTMYDKKESILSLFTYSPFHCYLVQISYPWKSHSWQSGEPYFVYLSITVCFLKCYHRLWNSFCGSRQPWCNIKSSISRPCLESSKSRVLCVTWLSGCMVQIPLCLCAVCPPTKVYISSSVFSHLSVWPCGSSLSLTTHWLCFVSVSEHTKTCKRIDLMF